MDNSDNADKFIQGRPQVQVGDKLETDSLSGGKYTLAMLIFLLLSIPLEGQAVFKYIAPWPGTQPWRASATFNGLDLSQLENEFRKRTQDLSEEELDARVASNFFFLFFNMLNHRRTIVNPRPQAIVEEILAILELDERMAMLIRTSRRNCHSTSPHQSKEIVRRLRKDAKKLLGVFSNSFLEVETRSFQFQISYVKDDWRATFSLYLHRADQIHALLTKEVDKYFLNSAPALADPTDYQDGLSIQTLATALIKLSSLSEREIRP